MSNAFGISPRPGIMSETASRRAPLNSAVVERALQFLASLELASVTVIVNSGSKK